MRARALAVVLVALALAGCSESQSGAQGKPPAPPAVPVGAALSEERVVPVQVTTVGSVQAYTTVGVKSQVAGQIQQVHFTEGQDVKKGAALFTIDPRPFEAALRQAEANVAKDRAQLRQTEAALAQRRAEVAQAEANLERDMAQMDTAKVQEQRYATLVQKELVAREQYDQVRTNMASMQATVQADRAAVANARASTQAAEAMVDNARAVIMADEAAVDTARLQLGYTSIRAPMDGRTGNLLVQGGNVVKANEDNPMVIIAQIRPIYVSFAVPQQHLAAIKKYRADGTLKVEATPDPSQPPVAGVVTFMNNTVDPTTGTIQLKATFANSDNALWPGQYVDTALTLTTERAVVVPTQAVQAGQQGMFVFVVKADSTVESRPVKVGRRLARESVIEQGLKGGERVVTDGQLRLVPGSRVEVKPQKAS
jgi:membrane fusion protein, multidrug efflux system